ncbi:MAG: GMC family oxidoreductase [Acetobacteraceae bacterium]|nr:GMC family oxidoreductase [Acetobacteraceae bacterium]
MTIGAHFPPGDLAFDVCVVGAGPAGLAVALQCEARGLSVVVIEAGGRRPHRRGSMLNQSDILNEQYHHSLNVTTRHAFGGTSWAWGGHCVPFDAIDFEQRPYVAESGWPISCEEMRRWHKAAAMYLDCGEPRFETHAPGWQGLHGIDVETIDRKSRSPNLARAYGRHISISQRIWLCLEKPVIGLELDWTGERVVGVRIQAGTSSRLAQMARLYVLAGGGLESTRLLLDVQRDWPRHFGGDDGPLGRYYMGHIGGELATIVFNAEADATEFLVKIDPNGVPTLRRFWIQHTTQRSEHILNTAFMLRTLPFADHRHGSAALSLLALGLPAPLVRNGISPHRLHGHFQKKVRLSGRRHLRNLLKNPALTASEFKQIIQHKFLLDTGVPIIVRNKFGRYALRYHAEQVPNPESRVWLADRSAPFGAPPLSIDFRYTEQDADSVVRAHEVLDRALRASGRGRLEYWHPPEERLAAVLAQATDGYHQVGTTRMHLDPRQGVVDPDCRVHGVRNLFVASSSVFPTTGQANPTFTIAALAARLASHLAEFCRPVIRDIRPQQLGLIRPIEAA